MNRASAAANKQLSNMNRGSEFKKNAQQMLNKWPHSSSEHSQTSGQPTARMQIHVHVYSNHGQWIVTRPSFVHESIILTDWLNYSLGVEKSPLVQDECHPPWTSHAWFAHVELLSTWTLISVFDYFTPFYATNISFTHFNIYAQIYSSTDARAMCTDIQTPV